MSRPVDLLITKQARQELKEAIEDMERLNKSIIEIGDALQKFTGKGFKNPVPSDVPKRIQESSKWLSDLNANYRESERLSQNVARKKAQLAQAESQNARELARLREETRAANAALKEEGILSSKLVGEFKKLETARNRQARVLRDLIASEKASNREIRNAQREFDRLHKRVEAANIATKNFRGNVGNYGSALSKASYAFRSFLGVLGVYSTFQIAKDIYEQIKAIDGLNLALQQVTETASNYNQTQEFIKAVAEEAGAEIFGLTSAYTKFLASAKVTNLTADETKNIFRQVAKAAGVLGLSQEATNGAFRALEQILSKGKVQAEEIRGQLGERLPGAFQILAQSMGLTTAELSKQLELGNVLSDEVLPGFAEELAKVYSLDTVQRVETLAAAQTRLGNAWKEFIANVEGGEGTISRVFKQIFETLTLAIEFFDDMNKTVEETREEFNKGLQSKAMEDELTDLQIESMKTGRTIQQTARLLRAEYTFAMNDAAKNVKQLKEEIAEVEKEETKSRASIKGKKAELEKLNKELEAEEKLHAIKAGRLDAINKVLKEVTKSTRDYNEETNNGVLILEGSIAFLERFIKQKEDERDRLAITTEQYRLYTQEIEAAKKALEELERTFKNSKVELAIKSTRELADPNEFEAERASKQAKAAREINDALLEYQEKKAKERAFLEKYIADQTQKVWKDVFSSFADYYDLDMTAFQKLLENKKANMQDFANFAKSLAQTIAQSQIISYENELEAKRRQLEQLQNNEEASDKQKKIAKEKFAKEEAAIRLKQAKAERTALLVQVAIDTAAAIAKILTTAAVLAANPITAPFAPNAFAQAAIAAGVGAAQAAFILAQPLPKFAKGTDYASEGPAITDEQGPELHLDRHGRVKDKGSSRGARVKYLEKGDKILTAEKTRKILSSPISDNSQNLQDKIDLWIMQQATPTIKTDGIERVLSRGMQQIGNRPIVIHNKIEKPFDEF